MELKDGFVYECKCKEWGEVLSARFDKFDGLNFLPGNGLLNAYVFKQDEWSLPMYDHYPIGACEIIREIGQFSHNKKMNLTKPRVAKSSTSI